MNFSGDHSAHGLQFGQAPRGRRSGASGWPSAPASRGPGGVATGGARRSERLIGNCRARGERPSNAGTEGEDFRSAYRLEDATMAPPTRPRIVIGLDVGKSVHWACVVTREGELLSSSPHPVQGKRHRLALRAAPGRAGRLGRGGEIRVQEVYDRLSRRPRRRRGRPL